MRKRQDSLTLIGLDIAGEWNVPLLRNAARLSGASIEFASSEACETPLLETVEKFEVVRDRYDYLIACETNTKPRLYDFPAPRGHTAIVVGNERTGIPRAILKTLDAAVSVPMTSKTLSSVNVAVASAIVLYVLQRDLGRRGLRKCALRSKDVDLLISAPQDASELGSLIRSSSAFGWRKIYLDDPHAAWFTNDKPKIMAGRAAARREINPLVVAPWGQLRIRKYGSILHCGGDRSGTPLSRLALPRNGPVLVVFPAPATTEELKSPQSGIGAMLESFPGSVERVHVDFRDSIEKPCFRHEGSVLLSMISEMLK